MLGVVTSLPGYYGRYSRLGGFGSRLFEPFDSLRSLVLPSEASFSSGGGYGQFGRRSA
jgi:hypothetical protein